MEDGRTELKRKSAEMNNDSEAVLDSSIKEMRTDRKTASSVEEFLENPRELIPTDEILNTDETILTHAVKILNEDAVRTLIEFKVNPNTANKKGVTPISAAAHKGNVVIMQILIDAGAQVNALNTSGSTALIQASHFGHVDAVKLLLKNNATADFANVKGTTALMRASQEGHVEISAALIAADADVNRKNHEGMNALMLASQRGHAEMVMVLIKAGAAMDEQTSQGSTALMLACKRGHAECVEVLVSMGCEIYMRDCRGRTARDTAMRRSHLGLLRWLNSQVQIQRIRENRRKQRSLLLMEMRFAYERNRLQLDPTEKRSQNLLRHFKNKYGNHPRYLSLRNVSRLPPPIPMSFNQLSGNNESGKLSDPGSFKTSNIKDSSNASVKLTQPDNPSVPMLDQDSMMMDIQPPTIGFDGIHSHDVWNHIIEPISSSSPQSKMPASIELWCDRQTPFSNNSSERELDIDNEPIKLVNFVCEHDASGDATSPNTVVSIDHPMVKNVLKPRRPNYEEWQWPCLLLRCLSLPHGVFELIVEMMPLPRVWQWSLWRLRQRCKLAPQQAALDLSILMDEILNDSNIFQSNYQHSLLVKLSRNPQIHPHLIEQWSFPHELIEAIQTWADVQSLLNRTTDVEVSFKTSLVRRMHVDALALFRWYRYRSSAQKVLYATQGIFANNANSSMMTLGLSEAGGLSNQAHSLMCVDENDDGDNMDATDAGGEEISDAELDDGMMDDTETELMHDGVEYDPQDDSSDSEQFNGY